MALESKIETLKWTDSSVLLIDQRKIPYSLQYVEVKTYKEMYEAIQNMTVRGAPAIGIAGAYGVALGAVEIADLSKEGFFNKLEEICKYLISSRPTAVNLFWAVNQQNELANSLKNEEVSVIVENLILNAQKIHREDIEINKNIGKHGAKIIKKGARILTHCNAGALATGGYGTALGVIREAFQNDPTIQVFADETRPRLQGAKLTVWELLEDNIPVTLITDGMCGYFMSKNMIDVVIVGADRIALNGDTANKIGTYTVAIAAKEHNIPFYIAAPISTIDFSIKSGEEIPVENRSEEEVIFIDGKRITPEGVNIINPSFDVTPAKFISGIITEHGILEKPFENSIKNLIS